MAIQESPDFNGLSEEAFMAGIGIIGIIDELSPAELAEVAPALVGKLGYSLLTMGNLDLDQASEAAGAFHAAGRHIERAISTEAFRRSPRLPRPEDDI